MKRIMSLLLIMVMVFTIVPVTVLAVDEITEPTKLFGEPTGIEIQNHFIQMMTVTQSERNPNPNIVYTYSPAIMNGASPIIFTDSTTGMPAYCIDYNRSVPSPDSLDGENDFDPETIFDSVTYEGLKCLLLAGYPYETGNGLTNAEAQGCTQLAVWCWTYETMGYGLNANNYSPISGKEYIYDYFTGLMEAARNQTCPELELSATDVHMVKDGDMLTGHTTVSFHNLNGGYSLDESKLPNGITVTGYTGNDGDVLTFTAPLSFAGQNLELKDILSGHDERSDLNLFWYDNKNPSQQRMAISVTDTATIAVSAGIEMEFEGLGNIKLIKLSDSDDELLSDAVFGVYRAEDNEFITEITTDENGEATLMLSVGEYYLWEHTAPDGYIKSDDKISFSIVNGETVQKTVINTKKAGFVEIIKTDSQTESPLDGVVFGVFKDGEKICELTTGADGTVTSPALDLGAYELRELSTVIGYQLLDRAIPFEISENGVTVTLDVENDIITGSVKIIKKDDTEKNLNGAVFGIYTASNDVKIAEVTTSGSGLVVYDNLPYGSYYLKELTAPEGFLLSSEKIPFEVKTQGEIIELTVINTKEPVPVGRIRLIKTDADTAQALENAVFGVYITATDAKVCELKTDANGTAVSPELLIGDYYLKELSAPDGYELRSDKISVTVKDSETVKITVTNNAIPKPPAVGKIKLTKKDADTAKLLQDAVFGVYNATNNERVCELTTNANGIAISPELPVGDYYLKELFAPVGYELTNDKISVTVTEDKTIEISVTNNILPTPPAVGKIKVIKKDTDTGKLLPNAVFGVYTSNTDIKVCELKTDEKGTAVSNELPVGNYYLKELSAPDGYKADSDKISVTVKEDKTVEITVTNEALPTPTVTGKVKIIKKADDTGKKLSDAVFGLYNSATNDKVCELTTGKDGTIISSDLPVGDYYLKEIKAPSGYKLSGDKVSIQLKAEKTVEITVINYAETKPTDPEPSEGRIRLIKKDDKSDKRLSGAVFGVYKASNDLKVCELTTDSDGEAVSLLLPVGDYYLKELKAPDGYKITSEKFGVVVKADKSADITVKNPKKADPTPTPTPTTNPDPKPTTPTVKTGELLILKKAEQTGKGLSGAIFGVYRVSDDKKITELTTNADGKATFSLEAGEYYLKELKAPYGYLLESSKIYFSIEVSKTVTVEVTNERDEEIADSDIPLGNIDIPKTGEDFPIVNYVVGIVLLSISVICGIVLIRRRKEHIKKNNF